MDKKQFKELHVFIDMKAIVVFFIIISLFNQDKQMTLEDMKWKNRVVLYFPEEGIGNIPFTDSLHLAIEDRKIAYFIFEDSVVSNVDITFSPTYLQQLKNKYQLGSKGNLYVLLGLDGGVKLKKEDALDWDLIFNTIDAMPMRQSEIRKGSI